MKVRQEDRSKVIALMFAVVLVFGFVGYTLFNSIGPGSGATTTPSNSPTSGGTASIGTPTSGGIQNSTAPPTPNGMGGTPGTMIASNNNGMPDYATLGRTGPVAGYVEKNPFKAPVEKPTGPAQPAPQAKPNPAPAGRGLATFPGGMGQGPWLPINPEIRPTQPVTVTPTKPVEPPLPLITLKGIVTGNPVIAIIETAGQTQYHQLGDSLAPGVKIGRISERAIVVQQKGKKDVNLEVGRSIGSAPQTGQSNSAPAPQTIPETKPATTEKPSETGTKPSTATTAKPAEVKSAPVAVADKPKPARKVRRRAAVVRFVGRRI